MPEERFGFLVYSLNELHERLKAELARNPFLHVDRTGDDPSRGDDPPPPREPGTPG